MLNSYKNLKLTCFKSALFFAEHRNRLPFTGLLPALSRPAPHAVGHFLWPFPCGACYASIPIFFQSAFKKFKADLF